MNEVDGDRYRLVALDAVIPHLAGEHLLAAIACAEDIGDAYYRMRALSALAPRLDGEALERVLAGAFDAAEDVVDPDLRLRVVGLLKDVVEFDPGWLHATFVSAMYEAACTGEQNLAEVIGEIAPVLHLLWER